MSHRGSAPLTPVLAPVTAAKEVSHLSPREKRANFQQEQKLAQRPKVDPIEISVDRRTQSGEKTIPFKAPTPPTERNITHALARTLSGIEAAKDAQGTLPRSSNLVDLGRIRTMKVEYLTNLASSPSPEQTVLLSAIHQAINSDTSRRAS